MSRFIPQGMGWIPDLPDPRDYTFRHETVLPLLKRLKRRRRNSLPDAVDLRCDGEGEYFTEPEDQGPLNCSAAFSILRLVEYFERRARGRTFEGSPRFLYKVTRNVLGKCRKGIGDTGADLRTTLKVLTSIGVPPEEYWPYDVERFDEEPTSFTYSVATRQPGFYIRLAETTRDSSDIWDTVTAFLAAGFPIAFGFPVPKSVTADASIPLRADLDSIRGGQVVVAVGYKLNQFGQGQHALLIHNSWGRQWGDNGDGWLPIGYLRRNLARDFWTLINEDWLDSGEFTRPVCLDVTND